MASRPRPCDNQTVIDTSQEIVYGPLARWQTRFVEEVHAALIDSHLTDSSIRLTGNLVLSRSEGTSDEVSDALALYLHLWGRTEAVVIVSRPFTEDAGMNPAVYIARRLRKSCEKALARATPAAV